LKRNFRRAVFRAGLLVGCLDILAALVNFYIQTGRDPRIVLKYIASAVFGRDAYGADPLFPVMGLIFHFLIAFTWTLIFFFLYPRIKLMSRNRILTGVVYGLLVWMVMNRLVVPLSRAAVSPVFAWKQAVPAILILILAIGIPLSFLADRYYRRNPVV
jgi:hypothetical protein